MAESNPHFSDDTPSPASSVDSPSPPPTFNGIVMVSQPDTQDVFHTPPDDSSLHSSDNGGVERCAVNLAVDVDAVSQGFVNFCDGSKFVDSGKDSDFLGFSEVQPTQEKNVGESIMGSSEGKLVSEVNDISVKNNCSGKVACTADGVVEASGMLKSRRSKNEAATGTERGGNNSEKWNVFDVLRVFSQNNDDVEENHDHLSLLDVAKAHGVTFPRPRWWPDDDKFEH